MAPATTSLVGSALAHLHQTHNTKALGPDEATDLRVWLDRQADSYPADQDVAGFFTGLEPRTLETGRVLRRSSHPPYVKCGRRVVYRLGDLRRWMDRNTVGATAEVTP